MTRPPHDRLIEAAVRCYPTRWRDRHGDEAIELAALLVRDGTSGVSVAWSYLRGAAREQLVVRPTRRLGATVAALLVGATLIGLPLVLLDSLTPASADSSNEVIASISNRNDAAGQIGVGVQVASLQRWPRRGPVFSKPGRLDPGRQAKRGGGRREGGPARDARTMCRRGPGMHRRDRAAFALPRKCGGAPRASRQGW